MSAFRRRTAKRIRAANARAIASALADNDPLYATTGRHVIGRWEAPDDGRVYHDTLDPKYLRK